jgi:hypothetical protein
MTYVAILYAQSYKTLKSMYIVDHINEPLVTEFWSFARRVPVIYKRNTVLIFVDVQPPIGASFLGKVPRRPDNKSQSYWAGLIRNILRYVYVHVTALLWCLVGLYLPYWYHRYNWIR